MESIIIFGSLIVLFGLLLIIQVTINWPPCVLCLSVSLTWLGTLGLYWLGIWKNLILVAILLGASLTGLYYLIDRRLPIQWQMFRLPIFLTLLLAALVLLDQMEYMIELLGITAGLWLVFISIYYFKSQPAIGQLIKRLIACCRDW